MKKIVQNNNLYFIKFFYIFSLMVLCFVFLSSLFSYAVKNNTKDDKKYNILVSVLPIKGILYNIIKDNINKYEVEIIIENPVGHHNVDFSPKLINKINYSDYILFFNSLEIEKELDKKVQKNKLINLYNLNYISGDHHVWLSLKNLKNMYLNTFNFLYNIDKKNISYYKNNLHRTLTKIELYHNYLLNKLKRYKGKYILTRHNEYFYFARDYDLKVVPYEYNETEASLKDIQKIMTLIKEGKIAFILTASYHDNSVFSKLLGKTKRNLKIIVVNPFAQDTLKVFWDIYTNL